jgi:hypothetical protein
VSGVEEILLFWRMEGGSGKGGKKKRRAKGLIGNF